MSEIIRRREFLSNLWRWGAGLVGAAGVWTSWDVLQPLPTAGFGGKVRTIAPEAVPDTGAIEVPAARAYLVRIEGEVVALSEKCTHLGCRVPFCASSGQFECPCHGSVFNRAGEFRAGPAPRGMDRYPIEIGEDGLIYIDTSSAEQGPAIGDETIDEPPTGPSCATEGGEA
jgi:cytochrome b6-f complex iron-sulfur subunit